MSDKKPSPTRSTFRHGDLRRALLDAGGGLARPGGPGTIGLRGATRAAGVRAGGSDSAGEACPRL